ncbi:MAG: MBL fold metallo-hydrolase [Candidatus Enteromonas sp.]|jgi:phosphoribosyl 1,2-cyclic phosphodiesterase|nr:MBL fold metallo-hydrolase [Bacilli bacterium]MBQ2052489.1 MBL fold metallo-hydrolase [Bacilli bacterium]MEE3298729.1 MBL fold metallo-hydrolase [Candidatus Enteromonas sp.]
MKFSIVGSGSKGNACLIYNKDTLIQIDMGLPLKSLKKELDHLGKTVNDIQALFITHEHTDHIAGIPLYHDRVDLYAGEGTYASANPVEPFIPLEVGSMSIVPFPTSHDATNPMGYLIEEEGCRLGYVTDTGYLSDEALALIKDCDYYYFESNHDLKMLMDSARPAVLKKRIHSKHGHLSNIDSAIYMAELIGPRTKAIYLAHLSEECNTPEIALSSYHKTLDRKGIAHDHIKIVPASQWHVVRGGE